MSLASIFYNDEEYCEKLKSSGMGIKELIMQIRDLAVIFKDFTTEETEDLIYRLKFVYNKSLGATVNLDMDAKIPARLSLTDGDRVFLFRTNPKETLFKRNDAIFYCNLCGSTKKLKLKQLKKHISEVHP